MPLRFIDLFAGLGGFHVALSALGHECVFASELNGDLAELYEKNFGLRPHGDIRTVDLSAIPTHDILCAGFPCQPFSKAGDQRGLECPQWGDLIDYVIQILRLHRPTYFIIENVPNLVRHNKGRTWRRIQHRLRLAGYAVADGLLSPHHFGVPQIRPRAFIVGRRGGLEGFVWPEPAKHPDLSIHKILDKEPLNAKPLPDRFVQYLSVWQKFLDSFPKKLDLPSFPIWAMEFGATYPYQERTPYACGFQNLSTYRGSLGVKLSRLTGEQARAALPPYARGTQKKFPDWKIAFIRKNRELYRQHKSWIDEWLPLISDFAPSFQKLEWNCKGGTRNIWRYLIRFRASGIRVKQPTTAPSLVAMTTSQVPVIAWESRYMTSRECSRLQSLGELPYLPDSETGAFKALGNAVNVEVVTGLASCLFAVSRTIEGVKVPCISRKQRSAEPQLV